MWLVGSIIQCGDMGVVAGIDRVVVVEGGREVAAVLREVTQHGIVVGLAAMGMVNKWHHFSVWVRKCDKWSVHSLTVYKPSLFVFLSLEHVPLLFYFSYYYI